MKKLFKFLKDEEGAAAVEYAVLVGAIIAVMIATIISVGGKANKSFKKVDDATWP